MLPGQLDVSNTQKCSYTAQGPSHQAMSQLLACQGSMPQNEDAEPGTAPQECTYRKVWEDDGNTQRVEIEQTAMVFFKTIYTRMHVLQARFMRLTHASAGLRLLHVLLEILAYHLQSCLPMVWHWRDVCLRVI